MNDDEALAQLRRLEPDLASQVTRVDDGEVFDCGPFRALVSRSTDWAHLAQPIATPDDGAALAALDGRAAGTGFAARHGDGCEIMHVGTLPDLRRRGVAATMTSFLAHEAIEEGAHVLWLTAATPVARAPYERLGFRYVGDELTYVPSGEGPSYSK